MFSLSLDLQVCWSLDSKVQAYVSLGFPSSCLRPKLTQVASMLCAFQMWTEPNNQYSRATTSRKHVWEMLGHIDHFPQEL